MISATLILTILGTARSEESGGLDDGEQAVYTTLPDQYRHDLRSVEDLLDNISNSAYQRGEWIPSLKLDGFDLIEHHVIECLRENSKSIDKTVEQLLPLGFFCQADVEVLTAWVSDMDRKSADEQEESDDTDLGL
jgi:hypothetical protein